MLRVTGELAVEDMDFSFCGETNTGMAKAEVLRGGVVGVAVEGRDSEVFWLQIDEADSRASTLSAIATIWFAIVSKTSVTLTMALLTRQLSRPPKAIRAYVRF